MKPDTIVLAVCEGFPAWLMSANYCGMTSCLSLDWPGGAGNAFGTLYAWQKAIALAQSKGLPDIAAGLAANQFACAMYPLSSIPVIQ